MRRLIYFGIVCCLFYIGGANILARAETGELLEAPFVNNDFAGFSFASFMEPTIAPNDNWTEILVGDWKYKTVLNGIYNKKIFEGKVTYLPDSTFERNVTYSVYNKESRFSSLYIRAGGTVHGKWGVSIDSLNGTWWEEVEEKDCHISVSLNESTRKELNICSAWFLPMVSYGVLKDNIKKYEVHSFNKSKIEIEAKDLSDGYVDKYSLIKMGL